MLWGVAKINNNNKKDVLNTKHVFKHMVSNFSHYW